LEYLIAEFGITLKMANTEKKYDTYPARAGAANNYKSPWKPCRKTRKSNII
jgi:hypothetical protein